MEKLRKVDVYEILSQSLPKQNDFFETDYLEELNELLDFGIYTKTALQDLISKHKESALKIDAEPLDDFHIENYTNEYGKNYVNQRVINKFWFAYPALLRLILELEFGEKYQKYADERDGI